MSPTLISQQQKLLPQKFNAIKEKFESKRVILCQNQDEDILKCYQTLLHNYPQWINHTSLVVLSNRTYQDGKNVFYFENEIFEKFKKTAAVEIVMSSDRVVLLGAKQLQINDITNYTVAASLLHSALHTQPLNTSVLYNAYKHSQKRLFLFDYDGTLTPIVSNPADAQPTPMLLQYLDALCKDPCNTVWIISGRDQIFLDTHLAKIAGLGLSAEHGSFMKKAGLNDWVDMLKDADMSWKNVAMKIFEKYTKCNPGTVIEQKKSSITWHYRNANNTEEAEQQSELCHAELIQIPGVDILVGKMNLEVRSLLVNKGEVVKRIKQKQVWDFIMCAGDDQTDEDMFRVLQDDRQAFCVSVGPLSKKTSAKYSVEHSEDVVNIIGQLVHTTTSTL
ncbi:hypothetical protein INT48_005967 [Thamnidium elegans]|uniref:Trehalose 6-phosphate phosphatase n=1 Tax=Thamnidium elegans TaxID=101142 RepID=A0A8H7W0C4_9FUNG|nr:hypothetical protein INT48_005967 [Thamnidium elegans]